MEEKLAELNAARAASGSDPLRMGIGIHTGTVLLADIGAPGRPATTRRSETRSTSRRDWSKPPRTSPRAS
jgi:class 3 adenylate cyclase